MPLVMATLLIEANPLPRSCTLTDWCAGGPGAIGDGAQVGAADDIVLDGGDEAVVGVGRAVGAVVVTVLRPAVEPF
ncbi:MAG: hypothetical protein M3083_24700 [Actinomycetota bacterium]|nr:hypothetical protein [Actinomycetota bacterium]